MLQLHNTLSNSKVPFTPIDEGKIRLYVCGMTVYDYCHIGHARVMVSFDVITRYLGMLATKLSTCATLLTLMIKLLSARQKTVSLASSSLNGLLMLCMKMSSP